MFFRLRIVPLWLALLLAPWSAQAGDSAVLLDIRGPIGPATSQFILRGLEQARLKEAKLVILRMDTPGGLDVSMRDIIQAILASPVPVATYVAPGGARAASAGTYILYASHIAAMAPATNLGAATPVQIGGLPSAPDQEPEDDPPAEDKSQDKKPDDKPRDPQDAKGDQPPDSKPKDAAGKPPKNPMERKMINDARAYLRSLAQLRNRNADWAEQAVTEAASLSAAEALEQKVIDLVAADVPDLLKQVNGRAVRIAGEERTLATTALTVETIEPDWRNRLLAVITNPQVAYILMLVGVYGLFFELANPGSVAPGVLGGICLLLALFAFQVLPINYAGLALIILGLLFMIGEVFMPSFGILGLGGVLAFVVGSLMLWDDTGPGFGVPLGIVLGFALASALVLIGLGTLALRQRRRPAVSGEAALLGATAVVVDGFDGEGRVRVHSEYWRARSDRPLQKDARVRITGRQGLVLLVQPVDLDNGAHKP